MPLGAFKAALMGTAGTATTGDVVLLSTQTASGDASISFTSGITSTYGEYIFKVYNINPATNSASFSFQFNAAGGSGFNETITSTMFFAHNNEADNDAALGYDTNNDQAQGTDYQDFWVEGGNGSDESGVGTLHLFNPSSTTYVKHWYYRAHSYYASDYAFSHFGAGYINTTSAIDEISFKMSSGNFDGKIKMWGVK